MVGALYHRAARKDRLVPLLLLPSYCSLANIQPLCHRPALRAHSLAPLDKCDSFGPAEKFGGRAKGDATQVRQVLFNKRAYLGMIDIISFAQHPANGFLDIG